MTHDVDLFQRDKEFELEGKTNIIIILLARTPKSYL